MKTKTLKLNPKLSIERTTHIKDTFWKAFILTHGMTYEKCVLYRPHEIKALHYIETNALFHISFFFQT